MLASSALGLPEIAQFNQRSDARNGWSDHYGALKVGLAYAGLRHCEDYFHAIWQHGCQPPWRMHSPRLLAYNSKAIDEYPILVARTDQAELLHKVGFSNARAVGIPIVYVPTPKLERVQGSLVVFPTHTLIHDTFMDRSSFQRYAAEIKGYSKHFKEVAVCIHSSCIANGLWVKEFEAEGISIFEGASTNDSNALLRMRSLFERFETMTTNGWGSHVAYALAFGCKVSVIGTKPERSLENFLRDPTWAADTDALKVTLSDGMRQAEDAYLAKLRVPPSDAMNDVEWGRALIGAGNRLSGKDMRAVLRKALRTSVPRSVRGTMRNVFVHY